uniref:hypothetical protein n=1 Tax=Chryseobacterium sp. TaxID=1871047 RepID=UPI0032195AA1
MRDLYAIRHIPTGFYLPEPTGYGGRGGSFSEPVDCSLDGPNPRLFTSMLSAKRALTQWLRGEHHGEFEYEDGYKYSTGATVVFKPERIKEDMEVVPFTLKLN